MVELKGIEKKRELARQMYMSAYEKDADPVLKDSVKVLEQLDSALDEVIAQLHWCRTILNAVESGELNKLGSLQGNASLLDTAVARAAVLVGLLPDSLREKLA